MKTQLRVVPRWGMNPATPACQAVCVFALNPTSESVGSVGVHLELSSAIETDRCDFYGEQNSIQANHRHSSLCHSVRFVSYFVTLYLCGYLFWYLIRRNSEDSEWNGTSKEEIVLPDHLCTSFSTKKSLQWERCRLTAHESNILAKFLLSNLSDLNKTIPRLTHLSFSQIGFPTEYSLNDKNTGTSFFSLFGVQQITKH